MVEDIKNIGIKWVEKLLKDNLTFTKPGSISYLVKNQVINL
jgi:hypothetical protein